MFVYLPTAPPERLRKAWIAPLKCQYFRAQSAPEEQVRRSRGTTFVNRLRNLTLPLEINCVYVISLCNMKWGPWTPGQSVCVIYEFLPSSCATRTKPTGSPTDTDICMQVSSQSTWLFSLFSKSELDYSFVRGCFQSLTQWLAASGSVFHRTDWWLCSTRKHRDTGHNRRKSPLVSPPLFREFQQV